MERSVAKGLVLFAVFLVVASPEVDAKRPPFQAGPWKPAHATFYGNSDGSGTFGPRVDEIYAYLNNDISLISIFSYSYQSYRIEGACGYGEEQKGSYGVETAAVSTAMFKNGEGCGACYEIKCANSPQWCLPGSLSLFITATNFLPSSYGTDTEHFDLSQPSFLKIAQYQAGVVPVQYRRVPCMRSQGIRFTISTKSNPWFLLVLVWNVGGAGDVVEVQIKGSDGRPWRVMRRNWGQYWQADDNLIGQQLTFRVKASDGRTSTSWRLTPKNWQFGQTFVGKNFR
ncbi:hypothetical protein V2J09_009682 [Rumex salicifolius]